MYLKSSDAKTSITELKYTSLIKIIIKEENFKWHLEVFASELFIWLSFTPGWKQRGRRGRCGGCIWRMPHQTFMQRRKRESSACTEMYGQFPLLRICGLSHGLDLGFPIMLL